MRSACVLRGLVPWRYARNCVFNLEHFVKEGGVLEALFQSGALIEGHLGHHVFLGLLDGGSGTGEDLVLAVNGICSV